ncbi:CTNA1 protein, partial [Turnix velox]|nr:CTNA1 protein [Turnix velox]
IQAASWLLECLSVLRVEGDMPGLLAAFQAFSEALLLLSNLTAKCLQELRDCSQQKSLTQTLQLLQKCIPLLHAAKHIELKHPWDQHVNSSKDYAFQLTERTIKELTSMLINNTGSKESWDRNGTFSQHVSRLLALLSCPEPVQLSGSEFSTHVEAAVFYCMLLADSTRSDVKLELVKHSWALLQLRKSICSHISQQGKWPGQRWGERSLEKECHTMQEEIESLKQAVLTATFCQILDAVFESKEPLRQLVVGALSLAGTECFPVKQGGLLKKLQPVTVAFFTHAHQMLRVAAFVLARCTKTQVTREIREKVEHLKHLLASLPPLLTEMSRNTAQMRAAEQLQALYHTWAGTTESFLQCFEESVSMSEFLQLSIQEMAKSREWCEKALESQDAERLSWHGTRLISCAQWVVEAATRYVDRATDPIFRNGLLVWVEQLANSILELKAFAALCPERQTKDVFSKAVSCLMASVHCVQDGLDGSNHPDILSPLREQVRSTDIAKTLELSLLRAGLKTVTGKAALQEDILSHLSPQARNLHAGMALRRGDLHLVITALLVATRAHNMAAVNAACSALLELSTACINAAKEGLTVSESPQVETLDQYQQIVLLTPCVINLARETASKQLHYPDRLLQMALTLSERICEMKECLAAVAGSWYSLSQQVFGFGLSDDFLSSKQALDETMMCLAAMVQLAEDITNMACSKENPISRIIWESFLQVQAKFSCAQMNTKVLFEKAASYKGSCKVGKAILEIHCVQWAISIHVLLGTLDGFIGRDILFLSELRSAMKNKLCLQSLLTAVSENSLRLQEAAWLSYLSCPEDCDNSEILGLREEIKVLVEALLNASNILSVSPRSASSLYIRFELLQRDLALRAKALLLHLEKVNTKQLWVIRDVVGSALSPLSQEDVEKRKEAFEEKASQLMANVQWVKTTLQDVLEASAQMQLQENLLSIADHLLVLTSDAMDSARQLLESCQDKRHLHLDSIVWYWSAKAHYLITQLQAVPGINEHNLQLMQQHLQKARDQHSPRQENSTAKLLPAQQLDALNHTKTAEICLSRRQGTGDARGAHEMVQ